MSNVSHRINGSVVKAWFQYRCERKTRYEMIPRDAIAIAGIVAVEESARWAFVGMEYEKRVVAQLGSSALRPEPGQSLWDSVAIGFLKGEGNQRFACQVNLQPSTAPAELGLPTSVGVSPTLADLIERQSVGGETAFKVIDIKATRRPTTFHKAQVAFYAILLEARLRDLGSAAKVSDVGEIWHVPDDGHASGDAHQAETFALAPYRRMVAAFCREDLPRILRPRIPPDVDETFFHLYFKCEECPFLKENCHSSISSALEPGRRDVSAVAGLTHEAKSALLRLGIATVGQLAAEDDLKKYDGLSWSLRRRADLLTSRARAIQSGTIERTHERYTMLMPPRVDVAIYLAADFDPVGDRLATVACMIVRQGVVTRSHVSVLATSDRQAEADALVTAFGLVVGELEAIDAHNRQEGLTSGDALHAHLFLYETAEATAIQGAVARHLSEPRVRQGLLNMVRLFPPEDIVPEPEYRGVHHLPATAVRMVVEQLYALPAMVSYDMARVSQALADASDASATYRPGARFERPFSSLLSIDVIRDIESGRDRALVRDVETDVRARLGALREIVEWLLERNSEQSRGPDGPMLRLEKRPFRFWETFDPLAARDLDVLQAFELIEHRAGLLSRLVELARPVERRVDSRRCIAGMRLLTFPSARDRRPELVFEVPLESRNGDLGPESFPLVLTDGDHRAVLDHASWDDLSCTIGVGDGMSRTGRLTVTMSRRAFDSDVFQTMYRRSKGRDVWTIDLVHKDVNTDRIVDFLRHLAREPVRDGQP